MPRGGRRQGKPGANYTNRSDLALGPRKLPITTAPSQSYGEATALTDSQRQVPMGTGDITQPQDVMGQAQQFTPPPVVPMGAPSMNPTEPVTAGVNTGPSAPTQLASSPVLKGVALLNQLGDGASPEAKAIRDVLTASQGNQAAP